MRSTKGAKNVPAKTKVENIRQLKHSDNGVGVAKFSLNFDFGNFENETPNERVKKMSEEELDQIVEDQKSINTGKSTQFALRTWQSWLEQNEFAEAEKKPIEVYTKQELFRLLKHFYLEKRKAKGDEFKPSTLKTIQRGLDWHLQEKNAGFSIIRDEEFTITNANKARDAEVNFLKMSGKGNKPSVAEKGFTHILLPRFVTLLAV